MVRFVIVDGTGTDLIVAPNNEQYEIDYGNSHCSKLKRMFGASARYQRGPTLDGLDVNTVTELALRDARELLAIPEYKGMILIAHSRGAVAALGVAYELQKQGVDVDFMGIFDAVEMDCSTRYDADYIPSNVKAARHGERQFATLSRPLWGNCADAWAGGSNFRRTYWGTHGSLGGVPPVLTKENGDWLIYEAATMIKTLVTVMQGNISSWMIWDWILHGVQDAVTAIESRPPAGTQPGAGRPPVSGQPVGGGGGHPANGAQKYIVKSGDSLSLISGRYWGDVLLWPILYDKNKAVVGLNWNLIQPGQQLSIPDIGGYSKSELDAARARGRNY